MTADEIERIAQAEYERLAAVERLDIDGDIDSTLAETIAQLAEELEHGDEAVALPGGEVVTPGDPVIDKIEKETGIILNTEKRRELKTAFIRAQINAFDAILKRRRGLEADPVPMFNKASNATRVITARPSRGIQFVDAMAEYLAIKSPTWAYKTRSVFETSLRLFCDHIGPDKPLSEISRLDISAWREKMRRLHPRWASSVTSKELPLDDLIATYGQGTETLSDKTLSRHMSALHGLFAWALDTGHIDKANPATVSGGKSTPRHKRGVFTDKEVCEIFEGLKFETKPRKHTYQNAMPWIAALGAFSGARLESICSLKVSDVHQEGDVWFLDIQDDKTPAGVRRVPLHSKVIALGFLDYVQAHRGTWLWPSLGNPGKDRQGNRRQCGDEAAV